MLRTASPAASLPPCASIFCCCNLHPSTFSGDLSVAITNHIVIKYVRNRPNKSLNALPVVWTQALFFSKALVDSVVLSHSSRPWQRHHAPVVQDTIIKMSQMHTSLMLEHPIVYLWCAGGKELLYFGQSERGYTTRVREEFRHSLCHKEGVICSVHRQHGVCNEKLAIETAKYGLQRMLIVPYLLVDAAELLTTEDALIQRYRSMLNKQFYFLWHKRNQSCPSKKKLSMKEYA